MTEMPAELLGTGPHAKTILHRLSATASLSVGLHAEALEAARRARRGASAAEGASLAVTEAEALGALQRHREALGVASRALARRPLDRDVAARLRIVKGQALWMLGRVGAGVSEVRRAAAEAETPLSRAAAHESLGYLAWKEHDLASAEQHLFRAWDLYAECGHVEGLVGTLAKKGGLLQSAGRFEEALRTHTRRVEMASTTTRLDALALAYGDRGDLLANLGRWDEARRDLERASELFHRVSDPREVTLAGISLAMVDLAAGDLAGARRAAERARRSPVLEDGSPRHRAEHLLLVSDIELTSGDAGAADHAAVEALSLFSLVRDREGDCRSRVRRAHALLGMGRPEEALREARRAVRSAPGNRSDLTVLATLALGRVLLRGRRRQARQAFEGLLRCTARPWLVRVARLGLALASASSREDDDVRAAVAALERWGDRRILAFVLSDVDEILGSPAGPRVLPAPKAEAAPPSLCVDARVLLEAALASAQDGDWPDRFSRTMQAVRPALPWWRAAWVRGDGGVELRGDLERPIQLAETDPARAICRMAGQPRAVDLRERPWSECPIVVRHGLTLATVAPAGPQGTLYVDFRSDEPEPHASRIALAWGIARMLAGVASGDEVEPTSGEAEFPEIVGRTPAMKALFAAMSRVAASDAPVHVFGETGTGKEKVARALHARSRRVRGPFVALNASTLTDELFESELFGHVRGAFTGAVADRRGHVAEAEGGTLFIDEVADLTLRGQAKLLRFLQDREYRRVGESVLHRADVRVVTAANAPLEDLVRQKAFREDLMYRLNAIVLTLPPLRERGGDVALLARHFVKHAAAREGRAVPALRPEVVRLLEEWSWPGNVRELENEMQRLVVMAGAGPVAVEHLSARLQGRPGPSPGSLRHALQGVEREAIRKALERHGGNRSRTAAHLGVTRQALLGKMKRLGI
jgi:DNA-binding NtrC family response regulator/tetratricopeptide (TPR) repeat protein